MPRDPADLLDAVDPIDPLLLGIGSELDQLGIALDEDMGRAMDQQLAETPAERDMELRGRRAVAEHQHAFPDPELLEFRADGGIADHVERQSVD